MINNGNLTWFQSLDEIFCAGIDTCAPFYMIRREFFSVVSTWFNSPSGNRRPAPRNLVDRQPNGSAAQ